MKKLLLSFIVLICLFHLITNAQTTPHTLAFSRALLITSATQTVPDGTVWKINNIFPSGNVIAIVPNAAGTGTTNVVTVESKILVNGNTIIVTSSQATQMSGNNSATNYPSSTTSTVQSVLTGPLWLPATTTLAASTNVRYISVLEFIVQ